MPGRPPVVALSGMPADSTDLELVISCRSVSCLINMEPLELLVTCNLHLQPNEPIASESVHIGDTDSSNTDNVVGIFPFFL